MISKIYPFGELKEYKYVVVLSLQKGRPLFSRHKQRQTWETQGGHVESGETPFQAAERELYEESGAVRFELTPLCDYWASDGPSWANGAVFLAEIEQLGPLPESEMAEVRLFDALPSPDSLTYPGITPNLYAYAMEHFPERFTV